jgi:hypothetical protein
VDAADFALSGGLPVGGTYSGTGVSGGNFSPSTAGAGTHTLTYTYTDGNGCTSFTTQTITVNEIPSPVISGPVEVCEPVTETYSTPDVIGNSFTWNVSGGSISGPSNSHTVIVDWSGIGAGSVEVTETIDATGCDAITPVYNITKFETPVLLDINSNNKLIRR